MLVCLKLLYIRGSSEKQYNVNLSSIHQLLLKPTPLPSSTPSSRKEIIKKKHQNGAINLTRFKHNFLPRFIKIKIKK